MIILFIILGLSPLFLFIASVNIGWNFYIRSFNKSLRSGNEVMLTFDDGPHPGNTEKVLDILAQSNTKAIFFLIGERAIEHPEIVRRIVREGHLAGIHSMRHTAGFTVAPAKMVTGDLDACRKILEDLSGEKIYLFRPPFGVTNFNIAKAVRKLNLKTIGWSVRSFDTAIKSPEKVIDRVAGRIHPGAIVLLHDRLPESAEILSGILREIKNRGLKPTIFKEIYD